jgi:hypothetical protein
MQKRFITILKWYKSLELVININWVAIFFKMFRTLKSKNIGHYEFYRYFEAEIIKKEYLFKCHLRYKLCF